VSWGVCGFCFLVFFFFFGLIEVGDGVRLWRGWSRFLVWQSTLNESPFRGPSKEGPDWMSEKPCLRTRKGLFKRASRRGRQTEGAATS